MEIKIKGEKYKVKQTVRALFLFEQITQKPFEMKSTLDNYLFFYCILLANNPDFMDWDNFIECIDDDPNILAELSGIVIQQEKFDKIFETGEVGEDNKKKD